MKPHPRIRKAIKWGGAAVTVLLAGLLVISPWWVYQLSFGNCTLYSFGGSIGLDMSTSSTAGDAALLDFSVSQYLHSGIEWWSSPELGDYTLLRGMHRSTGWKVEIPTVLPLSIAFGAAVFGWLCDTRCRRACLNLCSKCNYDRAGLAPGVVCPECGSTPT